MRGGNSCGALATGVKLMRGVVGWANEGGGAQLMWGVKRGALAAGQAGAFLRRWRQRWGVQSTGATKVTVASQPERAGV